MYNNPAIINLAEASKAVDELKDITEIHLEFESFGAYSAIKAIAKTKEKEIPIIETVQKDDKVVTENVCNS